MMLDELLRRPAHKPFNADDPRKCYRCGCMFTGMAMKRGERVIFVSNLCEKCDKEYVGKPRTN